MSSVTIKEINKVKEELEYIFDDWSGYIINTSDAGSGYVIGNITHEYFDIDIELYFQVASDPFSSVVYFHYEDSYDILNASNFFAYLWMNTLEYKNNGR